MNKKLGYYVSNGIEFESKLQALMYANFAKKPVEWVFNNNVFDNYTWTDEPDLTIDQLYDIRSRQIREEYDYVILSFSGGSDSNNILESFLRQGLHIDEVVTNWALDASESFIVHDKNQRSTWNNVAEFKLNTVDRLNYIRNKSPRTKITVLDTSRALVDSFIRANDESWVENKREVLNANGASNYNFVHFKEVRKTFDRNFKIALVMGLDKPKLKIVDNNLYLYFLDKIANIISIQDHIQEYPNANTIYYYWAPESCAILAKQAHIMRKFLQQNIQYQGAFSLEAASNFESRRVTEELMKRIIYTNWNPEWFQAFKSTKDWDNELDYWFSRGWAGTKEYEIWKRGLAHVAQRIPNFLLHEKDGSIRGTQSFHSRDYYIGPVNQTSL